MSHAHRFDIASVYPVHSTSGGTTRHRIDCSVTACSGYVYYGKQWGSQRHPGFSGVYYRAPGDVNGYSESPNTAAQFFPIPTTSPPANVLRTTTPPPPREMRRPAANHFVPVAPTPPPPPPPPRAVPNADEPIRDLLKKMCIRMDEMKAHIRSLDEGLRAMQLHGPVRVEVCRLPGDVTPEEVEAVVRREEDWETL